MLRVGTIVSINGTGNIGYLKYFAQDWQSIRPFMGSLAALQSKSWVFEANNRPHGR